MQKLALSDDILLQVEKPARYLGNEINAVHKEIHPGMIRFAMAFPPATIAGAWCPVPQMMTRSG